MNNIHQIREVSTLSFNERVLQEAEDERNPLMERLRFLGIFSSNMDEFFKVRVATIKRRLALGNRKMIELLKAVNRKSYELDERFQAAYATITVALASEGVRILTEKDMATQASGLTTWLSDYFNSNVLPTLVPIIIQNHLPFPQLIDGALYFGVKMWGKTMRYAILEIPAALPRFVELPNRNIMYVDDVIRYSLNKLFYIFDYTRIEAFEFKISRDAELDIDNDFSESYLRKMERELEQRKGGRPTRLVYDAEMPPGLLAVIVEGLELGKEDTRMPGGRYHNMKDLMRFPVHRLDLAFNQPEPAPHPVLNHEHRPMLDIIEDRDLLVTYPYQSFDHVVRLLREAAIDPGVEEIQMTLYRVAHNSQIVNALGNAARNGKQILASVELQARFDEKNNIEITERLTDAGARVVFGVPPMKVHCKLLLIRRNGKLVAGLSTGNFNEATGKLYVDSTLLTADPRLTQEVAVIFEFLEQASRMRMLEGPRFRQLLVSPFNLRSMILKLLAREKAKSQEGYVFLKVNHLTDSKIIRRIRDAADAGVHMDLVVRTTHALVPHPNIRAISILDRYLEHQRVYLFGRGDDVRVYMSSGDLMERNLDWRIEVGFPIYDPDIKQEVADMMAIQVADNYKARILDAMQCNHYVNSSKGERRAQHETYLYIRRLYDAYKEVKLDV
jgi:polyphosphate kinase